MEEYDSWARCWGKRRTFPATNGVHVGALVKIADNASFWNGEKVQEWYRRRRWYVTGLDECKATLGADETGHYKIRVPICTNFLTVLRKAEEIENA